MKTATILLALIISTMTGLFFGQIIIGFLVGVIIALPIYFFKDIVFVSSVSSSTRLNRNNYHYDTSETFPCALKEEQSSFSALTGSAMLSSFMDVDGELC